MFTNYILGLSAWTAILIGVIAVLAAQAGFSLLGFALGITPAPENQRRLAPATITRVWEGLTIIISMFLGAWVSSRLSGNIGIAVAVITGIMTWAAATLLNAFLAATAIGRFMGYGFTAVVRELNAAPVAPCAVPAESTSPGQSARDRLRREWPRLRDQFERVLKQTTQQVRIKTTPSQPAEDTESLFRQVMHQANYPTPSVDKSAVAAVIEQRTNMNRQQATATADRWVSAYQQELSALHYPLPATALKPETTACARAYTLSTAAAWSFFVYIVSLVVAAWGGWAGAV